ncbi:hypothetical protein GPECTOR_195g328 [Gonium pectorale]|uniref:CCHC-type domain-containing protein n=1 Tax=Gonium pectorale TaxID=33097 RepID=A0A150FX41_GONPE|nr:hypothetical protein GPECTOR_195g328 [Gonium pectorale]|eukprot:KXZ42148.1 hypothetical protein GPECTOR_195g328 [Gonium pectorale]
MKDVLKNLKPPLFSGDQKQDKMRWDEFAYKARAYFDTIGCSDAQRMITMPHLLTGDASLYWRMYIENRNHSFTSAMNELGTKFADRLMAEKARDKLRKLQYRGSVAQLTTMIDRHCLHIPDITDAEKSDRLIQCLPKDIRVAMAMQTANMTTAPPYQDLCTMAENIDHAIKSADQQSRPQASSSNSGNQMELNAINPSKFVPRNGRNKPASSKPAQAPSQAPKLSKLSPEEREELRRNNACFKCRQPGHDSKNCPTRKQGSSQQSAGSKNGKRR